jgi:thiosulfate dehydrogenase [quinone] large subunit
VTPFHGGPVSPTTHHWSLSQGQLTPQSEVTFKAYVDAGTPEAPSNIVRATLLNTNGTILRTWSAEQLSKLPKQAFRNDYDYQKIHVGPFGLVGPIGSMATVTLPADPSASLLEKGHYALQLTSVNGRSWTLPLTLP